MIYLDTIEAYELAVNKGFVPLIDVKNFTLDIRLRNEVQETLFGKKCPANDDRFFKWVWKFSPHVCVETGAEIPKYRAIHMSHILSKGAQPAMRYDPRNINIVLYFVHNIWEFGTEVEKKKLKIYSLNQPIIETLKNEYRELHQQNYH